MKEQFSENEKVRVASEVKIIKGLEIISIKPADVLRVVGYDRFGDVCARFDDCADTEAIHDALFGKFYLDPANVIRA